MFRVCEIGIPPSIGGLFTTFPLTYMTVELPPSRFIAFMHPSSFINVANSRNVNPTDAPSRPSAVIKIK